MLTYNELYNYIRSLDFDIIGFSKYSQINDEYLTKVNKKDENNTLYPRNNMPYQDYVRLDKLINKPMIIISVGISYHQDKTNNNDNLLGYYSKSSYGLDYHKYIYPKLQQIIEFIDERTDSLESFASCDTKIIDDRYFAYLCGNGFYGKNTMLINEEYGSEVFYGTIITNIDMVIPEVKQLDSLCNDCNLCEKICPTKSLNNYNLNYKSCLAYLTQSRHLISSSIIKNKIYGCDDCNDICPYNKKVTSHSVFKNDSGYVNLIQVIKMSNSEYNNYFKDKSLLWLNKTIIKKNAILCLGNYLPKYHSEILSLAREVKSCTKSSLLIEAFDYILQQEGN